MFGLSWKEAIVGGVGFAASFLPGGPLTGAAVSGLLDGVWTGIEKGDVGEGFKAGATTAGMGLAGGLIGGRLLSGVLGRAVGSRMGSRLVARGARTFGARTARAVASPRGLLRGSRAIGTGVGSAIGADFWNAGGGNNPADKVASLPVIDLPTPT
ncbi:hypothetical protein [Nocardia blacklockiae]|uniref:hypothetical protein n=1 Tax=Nocardia blacklockiae TaxID=480036 RepID=UPI0018946926|nr:hypothetical protein [Nocardia blacklockiae]MBF6175660.1 hypothetical protein [Nocardia blacklockiae]